MGQVVDLKRGIYRRLYSGAIKGKRINAVSVQAEMVFWRLHMIADDFGNFEAEPDLLRAAAFVRRPEITTNALAIAMGELTAQALVARYEHDGDAYGHIVGFVAMQPTKNGKRARRYPEPPWNDQNENGLDAAPLPDGPDGLWDQQGCPVDPDETSEAQVDPDVSRGIRCDNDNDNDYIKEELEQDQGGFSPPVDSDSDSAQRQKAWTVWSLQCSPLVGMDAGAKHPQGSPKYNADLTCVQRWFDTRVWPVGLDDVEGQRRLTQALEIVKRAPGRAKKQNPMQYVGHYTAQLAPDVPRET